tara:strand:- start:397 stop:1596 length:1200 start_codon:yes stop_codon:yes gene_type:complete
MTKEEQFLFSLETQGIKLGLERTSKLLSLLKNPHNNYFKIQIVGTNGKGSTAAMMSSILLDANVNVGTYTSPHLVDFKERIKINGEKITNQYIQHFINQYKKDIIDIGATFFEVMTALAINYFYDNGVEIALLETGLGGRYDSVTACNSDMYVFTEISKDHSHLLGDDIRDIAKNKAMAITHTAPCISLDQKPEIKFELDQQAFKYDTSIDYIESTKLIDYKLSLYGDHQNLNANLVAKAMLQLYDRFNIKDENIINGLKNIYWPGRFQILQSNPTVLFDVCHNETSILTFLDSIKKLSISGKKYLLISIQNTKDITSCIDDIQNIFDTICCTRLDNDRMMASRELASNFTDQNQIMVLDDSTIAIDDLLSSSSQNDLIAIIGTHLWGPVILQKFNYLF